MKKRLCRKKKVRIHYFDDQEKTLYIFFNIPEKKTKISKSFAPF